MERSEEIRDQALMEAEIHSPPLAWDSYQRRYVVAKTATWWRVLRKRPRGHRPTPLNTSNGPLHIGIEADFAELSEAVNYVPGWYILHAVDARFEPIADVPAAHVEVVPENRPHESGLDETPTDAATMAVQQLTDALQKSLMAGVQREQAMLAAFTEMASNVYQGFAHMQQSTAALVSAVQGGYDIASGVSIQKLPPPPETPPPPQPPQEKSFLEFLCSPAGNTAISALGGVLKAAVGDDK